MTCTCTEAERAAGIFCPACTESLNREIAPDPQELERELWEVRRAAWLTD